MPGTCTITWDPQTLPTRTPNFLPPSSGLSPRFVYTSLPYNPMEDAQHHTPLTPRRE